MQLESSFDAGFRGRSRLRAAARRLGASVLRSRNLRNLRLRKRRVDLQNAALLDVPIRFPETGWARLPASNRTISASRSCRGVAVRVFDFAMQKTHLVGARTHNLQSVSVDLSEGQL